MDLDFQPLVDAFLAGDYVALAVLVVLVALGFALRALAPRFPALGRVADVLKRLKLGSKPAPSELPATTAPVSVEPEDKAAGIAGVKPEGE